MASAAEGSPATASLAAPEAKQENPAPATQAPPGYKLIKVRKPDGTTVTVKKKLSPEELAAQGASKAEGSQAVAQSKADNAEYKIITVRKPDGTLASKYMYMLVVFIWRSTTVLTARPRG